MGQALVDIIIPTRNRHQLLLEAIQSVRGQTLTDWRLIIVDDGSDDGSVKELAKLAREDVRVELAVRSERGGPQAARQTGFERSTAPFIATLDSDDLWLPTKLERQMDRFDSARSPVVGAVLCWHDWVDLEGRPQGKVRRPHGSGRVNPLISTNMSTIVMRREALEMAGGFLPPAVRPLFTSEGIEFYVRLTQHCAFSVVDERLVRCRHHPGERANHHFSDGGDAEEIRYILRLHRTRLARYPEELAKLQAKAAGRYLAAGMVNEGSQELVSALRVAGPSSALRLMRKYGPFTLKSWAVMAYARLRRKPVRSVHPYQEIDA